MQQLTSLFARVTQTISQLNLNPINSFIKYSLDKLFDQLFLEHQINLDDIRKGCVKLENLHLNTNKINNKHLFSSPYLLQQGHIARLKIQLPSLKNLQHQSIQLQIDQITIKMITQNCQQFAQNFKKIIQDIKQYVRLHGEDDQQQQVSCENSSRDTFKKLLKVMFKNLKVKVKAIVVVMQTVSPQTNKHLITLKVPLINLHRGDCHKKPQTNNHLVQHMTFHIEVPQFSVHIHEEKQNQIKKQSFPQINEASTVLLFGQQNYSQNDIQIDTNIPRIKLNIITDYQKGEKHTLVNLQSSRIALIINPQQIKTILHFAAHLNQFTKLLTQIKTELGLIDQGDNKDEPSLPNILLSRKSSGRRPGDDLFGSICMSFWESGTYSIPQHPKRKPPSLIDSIIDECPQLRSQLNLLNQQLQKSLQLHYNQQQQNQPSEQTHDEVFVINFTHFLELQIKITQLSLHLVKNQSNQTTYTPWIAHYSANNMIQQAYFLLLLKGLLLQKKDKPKSLHIQLSELVLEHVKYKGSKKQQNQSHISQSQSEDEFFDVRNSMDFYLRQSQQLQSEIQHSNTHLCSQQILRISRKLNTTELKSDTKRYNFAPPRGNDNQVQVYSPGLVITTRQKDKNNTANIKSMHVVIVLSSQIVMQILDFCILVKQMLRNNIEQSKSEQTGNKYKPHIPTLQMDLNSVSVTFYQTDLSSFKSSVEKYQLSEKDYNQQCFCHIDSSAIHLLLDSLRVHYDNSVVKVALKQAQLGTAKICDSAVVGVNNIIEMREQIDPENGHKQKFKLLYSSNKKHKPQTQRNLHLSLPLLQINLNADTTIVGLEMIHRQLSVFSPKLLLLIRSDNDKMQNHSSQLVTIGEQKHLQSQVNLKVHCSTLRCQLLHYQLYLSNLNIQKQTHQLLCHLSTIIVSTTQSLRMFQSRLSLHQFQFTQIMTHVPRYPHIQDKNILLEINNSQLCPHKVQIHKKKKPSPTEEVNLPQQSCLLVTLKTERLNDTNKSTQTISIDFRSPMFVSALNCLRLYHGHEQLIKFVEKVSQLGKQIAQYQLLQQQNKPTEDIPTQYKIEKQQIHISGGKLSIDIQPTFLPLIPIKKSKPHPNFKSSHHELVLSNTRSLLQLEWQDLEIRNFIENQQRYSSGQFRVNYYLGKLSPQNKVNEKPISLMTKLQREEKTFTKVLSIQKIKFTVEKIAHMVRPNISIGSICFQADFETICLLALHWQHFLNHDINKTYGETKKQCAQKVQQLIWDDSEQLNQDDQPVEDISNGLEIYNEKTLKKKAIQQTFLKHYPFAEPKPDQHCHLYLQNLSIHKLSVKLFSSKHSHIEAYLQNVCSTAKFSEQFEKIEFFIKTEHVEVNFVQKEQKTQGILGAVVSWWYKAQDECFPLFSCGGPIKAVLQIDKEKINLKFDKAILEMALTSELMTVVDQFVALKEQIDHSEWKKIYDDVQVDNKKIVNQIKSDRFILIYAPQTHLHLTLVFEGLKILESKQLDAPLFLLHEETQNLEKIKSTIVQAVEKLIKNNIKGLIASSAIDSFGSIVRQILRLVKFLISTVLSCLT